MFWFRVSSASGYDQSPLLTNFRVPNFPHGRAKNDDRSYYRE